MKKIKLDRACRGARFRRSRRLTRYRVSTNFTNGHGVGVLASSWKSALEEAIKWNDRLSTFRGLQAERTEWGWRIKNELFHGSADHDVVCIETRKR